MYLLHFFFLAKKKRSKEKSRQKHAASHLPTQARIFAGLTLLL
jgi:hypothetical protein